jgi:hypothetical protein
LADEGGAQGNVPSGSNSGTIGGPRTGKETGNTLRANTEAAEVESPGVAAYPGAPKAAEGGGRDWIREMQIEESGLTPEAFAEEEERGQAANAESKSVNAQTLVRAQKSSAYYGGAKNPLIPCTARTETVIVLRTHLRYKVACDR